MRTHSPEIVTPQIALATSPPGSALSSGENTSAPGENTSVLGVHSPISGEERRLFGEKITCSIGAHPRIGCVECWKLRTEQLQQ
jgi:hypothetical protein